MNQEEDDIMWADRYLQKELDGSVRGEIENRISNEPAFRKLVEDLKILRQGIRENTRTDLKAILDQAETGTNASKKVGMKGLYWPLGVAAVILVMTVLYLWRPSGGDSSDKVLALFGEVFEPYPNIVMPLERGTVSDSGTLALAYRAYEAGSFDKALILFEQYEPKEASLHFYLGVCYLAKGESLKARQNFEYPGLDHDTQFAEQAEWYEAISFLLDKDKVHSTEILERVASRGNAYSEKAGQLLLKLKSFE